MAHDWVLKGASLEFTSKDEARFPTLWNIYIILLWANEHCKTFVSKHSLFGNDCIQFLFWHKLWIEINWWTQWSIQVLKRDEYCRGDGF